MKPVNFEVHFVHVHFFPFTNKLVSSLHPTNLGIGTVLVELVDAHTYLKELVRMLTRPIAILMQCSGKSVVYFGVPFAQQN